MFVDPWVERRHQSVGQRMDMAFTKSTLWIEGDNGLRHSMAVQHTHPVPGFSSIGQDLPIQCLVDYEVRGFFEWDAGSTDILAAGSRRLPSSHRTQRSA